MSLEGGAFGSDIRLRGVLGLNVFYWQRFEIGGGLMVGTDVHDARAFVGLTYNVQRDLLVGIGLDNRHTAQVYAALKF